MKHLHWINTHRYCLAGLYLFVFLSGFFLLQSFGPEPRWVLHSVVDDWIPFNEWFVVLYFLWYLWVPFFLMYFMVKDKEAYLELCFIMFAGATICLAIYLLFPNGLNLREEIDKDNFCAEMVRFLRSIDPPRNVCPSIHVSSTVAIHLVICRARSFNKCRKIKWMSWAVTLGISWSTMAIKQHSVIDVLWGWVLSVGLGAGYPRCGAMKGWKMRRNNGFGRVEDLEE
ncbi:MAG: phosphatase PAP2 family protein [Lachnospiraceae bacterium]|nr:phosphatase PAP2 family protein [Lachnospiraceae bacterium]